MTPAQYLDQISDLLRGGQFAAAVALAERWEPLLMAKFSLGEANRADELLHVATMGVALDQAEVTSDPACEATAPLTGSA